MQERKALGPMLGWGGRIARERMEARLTQYDVTPTQTHVLLYLRRQKGQALQCELTEYLKVKPSTANGILDRMAEKELVTRSVSGSDARQRLIALTNKGEKQQELLEQSLWDTEAVIAQGLTNQELTVFRAVLGKIIQNLKEDRTTC